LKQHQPAIFGRLKKPFGTGTAAEVTVLLRAWSAGNQGALEQLAPVVHAELKRIAKRYMIRERKEHTLQPTALVNEAFLRLVDVHGVQWQDRAHFFALSAQMIRRILVNYALARGAWKLAGSARKVSLDSAMIASPERDAQFWS
jgi:RNA polymerase sigma factor (TIGR02999 family)